MTERGSETSQFDGDFAALDQETLRPWVRLSDADLKAMDPLSLWRTVPPSYAWSAHRSVIDGLRTGVATMLGRTEECGQGGSHEAECLAASLGDATAWRMLAVVARRATRGLGDRGPAASKTRADLRGTCLWLAVALGEAWSLVPLLSVLADLEPEDRQTWHGELLGCIASELPDSHDQGIAAISLGLPTTPVERGKIMRGMSRIEAARPTGAETLSAAEDGDEAPDDCRVRVVVGGDMSALKGDQTRFAVLGRGLPVREWPDPDILLADLRKEFPWCADALDRIHADLRLARRVGGAALRLPPTVLIGPPGGGKSRLAIRLAAAVAGLGGPGYATATGAGMADNRLLAGTARGWSSAEPSWAAKALVDTGVANPVLVLDELDKTGGSDANGRAQATLISLTEQTTAARYTDEGLGATLDVSRASWIFTANDRRCIDPVLRARLRFLAVPVPRSEDFDVLLAGVRGDLAREYGGGPACLPDLEPVVLGELERGFRAGRMSARGLAKLVRRAVELAAEGEAREQRH